MNKETALARTITTHLRTACATGPLLLLLTLPAAVQAQFNYTTNSGAITITGYTGSGGAVVIPGKITGLSVTSIGPSAFQFSSSLTSITISNNVTSIADAAFASCPSLTAITVDAANPAFASVAGVLFNKSLTTLVQYPGGKTGAITISNSVTSIGNWAFASCTGLTGVTIPSGVTSIGDHAFWACPSLTNVTIGNQVASIGVFAFEFCTNLSTVTIPNSVINIAFGAFEVCSKLTTVTIGNGVTNIGDHAFELCTNLTAAYFQGNAPSVGSFVFFGDTHAIVYYLPGTTGWASTFAGVPAVLLNSQVQPRITSFGVRTNRFSFSITGGLNQVIVVEAGTSSANTLWTSLGTNNLTGGSSSFSDPQWTNFTRRFYRLRSP
jgi:BspA type Leucine rich repeat region (6 copies)